MSHDSEHGPDALPDFAAPASPGGGPHGVPEPDSRLAPVPLEPTPPPAARNRAGRNLAAAVAVGLVLGALVLVSLFTRKELFVGVIVAAVLVALWELGNALAAAEVRVPVVPVVAGGVAMVVGAYAGGPEALLVATVVSVLAVLVWRMADGVAGFVRDTSAGLFALLYVPLLASFAALMLRPDDGPQRIITFILVTICSDIGGYAVGVIFGRHPMAPSVSPKKSWEGFAGSALACAVGGAVSVWWLLGGQWWQGVLLGLATVVTATLGDLAESMIKRDLGLKDMGSLLPGHGGLMDRLDSLLPTAPVAYALLALFVVS